MTLRLSAPRNAHGGQWLLASSLVALSLVAGCAETASRGTGISKEEPLQAPTAASAVVTATQSPSPTPKPIYRIGDRVVLPTWALTVSATANQPGGRTAEVVAAELAAKTGQSFDRALAEVRNAGFGQDSIMLRAGVAPVDPNAAVPSAGMRFIAVTVKLENTASRVQTTNPGEFRVQDGNGVRRPPRSEKLRPDMLGRAELAPSGTLTASLVFEAPSGDDTLKLVFGSGTSSEVTVLLAPR